MKYILICLILSSCSYKSGIKDDLMKDCFNSGGDEFHFEPGLTSICVYKNNSCRLNK